MMDELIKVTVKNDQQLASARDLHRNLGLTTRFSKGVGQNFDGFEEGQDFMSVTTVTDMPNGGTKPIQDYLVTIDMAKELCMMSKTEKGKEIRKYFIQVEKQFNKIKAMSISKPDSYMIEDPVKRAERWIEEAKERQKLEHKNEKMQEKIEKDADDVLFSHAIRYSNHAIKIRELAVILTQNGFVIGQNQLYKLLRLEHYISKRGTLPMGNKVKRGYFRVTHGIKNGHAWSTTLVTPKGQKHIISKALRGKFDDNYQNVIVSTFEVQEENKMREFENVHEILEELEAINDPQSELPRQYETDTNGTTVERPATAKELQELNYEDIAILCDLLGMSDIYRVDS